MDISVKTVEIDRRGKEGLICKDNIRADIKVTFFVRVNKTPEDVLKVAQSIGCARASDQQTLDELFSAKFSEALKTVGKQLEFEELYTKRERVQGPDHRGHRPRPQRLHPRRRGDRLPRADAARARSTRTTSSTPRASARSRRSRPSRTS
jgi:regulator of protease activity HflC (stomatin/prohibitin superfamily)